MIYRIAIALIIVIGITGCSNKKVENIEKTTSVISIKSSNQILRGAALDRNNPVLYLIDNTPLQQLPFAINDKLISKIDTTKTISDSQFTQLSLNKLKNPYGDHYKEIPLKRLHLSDAFYSIVLVQYYVEESYAWLINYDSTGSFIDAAEIYYNNAEGNVWKDAVVTSDGLIALSDGNIYKNEGNPLLDTLKIRSDGKFHQTK